MSDKNYINGIIIKGSKFGLNCSIKVDEFIEQLKAIEKWQDEKILDTYIKIGNDYKDCDFAGNWLKN